MTLATEWVAPGCGDTAGELWDAAQAYVPRLDETWRQPVNRAKRTRLRLSVLRLEPYDLVRIAAAIWVYDQEEGQ